MLWEADWLALYLNDSFASDQVLSAGLVGGNGTGVTHIGLLLMYPKTIINSYCSRIILGASTDLHSDAEDRQGLASLHQNLFLTGEAQLQGMANPSSASSLHLLRENLYFNSGQWFFPFLDLHGNRNVYFTDIQQ